MTPVNIIVPTVPTPQLDPNNANDPLIPVLKIVKEKDKKATAMLVKYEENMACA
jgi:hypothetical protein